MGLQVRHFIIPCVSYVFNLDLGRLVKQTFSDDTEKINKFMQSFQDLSRSFNTSLTVQTAFVSLRVVEGVETLRLSFLSRLFSLHPLIPEWHFS
jgi:hypothetical protein